MHIHVTLQTTDMHTVLTYVVMGTKDQKTSKVSKTSNLNKGDRDLYMLYWPYWMYNIVAILNYYW